jgi:APA family basic amino acid/polyamine antiporter
MSLARVLRTGDAAWLVAGNMIGAGMFLTPGLVAGHLPGVAWQLAAWIAGAALALAGAAIYGELGARIPRAGGDYQYLSSALGPGWGFLTAWGAFVLTFSAAAAAMARVAVDHFRAVAPGIMPEPWGPRVAAVAVVLALTAANVLGARVSSRTTLVLTAVPVTALVILFAVGVGGGGVEFAWPDDPFQLPPGLPWVAFGAAMVPVFFTYSGWNAAAYVAGEVADPGRSLPRGLLLGTAAVAVLYVGLAAALATIVPADVYRGSTTAGAEAARLLAGVRGERVLAAAVALAVLASVNVTLMAGARIYFAAAVDGLAPRPLARTNRYGVPHVALWIAGGWSAVLAATGTVDRLVTWTTLAILVLSTLTAIALVVLRRRDPAGAAFSCPGYPWTIVVYVTATLTVAVSSVLYDARAALAGVVLLALGWPVYGIVAHRRATGRRDA